jgi:hypothetical protein
LKNKLEEIQKLAVSKAEKEVEPIKWVEFWETSQRVREFQLLLKRLWYFEEKDTAIFWEKTKDALLNFQADNGVILRKDDENAGIVEEKTIKSFVDILAEWYLNEELEVFPEIKEGL